LPPAKQQKTHQSGSNTNTCTSRVTDSSGKIDVLPPSTAAIPVVIATDAFPQPHEGDPIELTQTSVKISIPGDLIQKGVDQGIISDGFVINSTVTLVIDASNASPSSHTYTVKNQKITIHVDNNNKALPVVATVKLPATHWTPTSSTKAVIFTEKSLKIVSVIPIGNGLDAIFSCTPNPSLTFLVLSAQGETVVTTTVPVESQGTTATTVAAATTSSGTGTLPRTGGNVLFLLIIAAMLVDIGFALTGAARKRMHHFE
jgi:hypothetical protein